MRDDSPAAPTSQRLVGVGILALLMMTVAASSLNGAARMVGTLVLLVVCLTCFVLALRSS